MVVVMDPSFSFVRAPTLAAARAHAPYLCVRLKELVSSFLKVFVFFELIEMAKRKRVMKTHHL